MGVSAYFKNFDGYLLFLCCNNKDDVIIAIKTNSYYCAMIFWLIHDQVICYYSLIVLHAYNMQSKQDIWYVTHIMLSYSTTCSSHTSSGSALLVRQVRSPLCLCGCPTLRSRTLPGPLLLLFPVSAVDTLCICLHAFTWVSRLNEFVWASGNLPLTYEATV